MSSDSKVNVIFQAADIISAQRMRFARGSKLKILGVIWLAAMVWGGGLLFFPEQVPTVLNINGGTLVGTALLFAIIAGIFYIFAPWVDFRTNPIWKSPFTFQFNDEQLNLSLEGRGRGVYIRWEQIRRVHENERVYILYTSSEDNFLILPRLVFPSKSSELRFRQLLGKRSSLSPLEKQRFINP